MRVGRQVRPQAANAHHIQQSTAVDCAEDDRAVIHCVELVPGHGSQAEARHAWDIAMVTQAPLMKPLITGWLRYCVIQPSRNRPITVYIIPAKKATYSERKP